MIMARADDILASPDSHDYNNEFTLAEVVCYF